MGAPRRRLPTPNLNSGPNPIDSYIPVARITDMLLSPGAEYDFNGAASDLP